jgi:cytosine/adenosine deaminase-related metal-dependent hydrolase
MPHYRAEWILPITDDPIRGGWVDVRDGRVGGVGSGVVDGCFDLGRAAVLPALVNAHTHLELSYLQGRVPAGEQFGRWIRAVMALRRQYPDAAAPDVLSAARAAIDQARQSGTGLFGDVSNTLVTVPLLRDAGMPARVFYELLGFNEADPEARVRRARETVDALGTEGDVRVSLAPHAPYSVSPALFTAIRADLDAHPGEVSAVHLGESPDEIEFLGNGSGVFRAVLEDAGAWTDDWRAPGVSPVAYLSNLGFLDSCVLVVHGVQLEGDDLRRLGAMGVTLVSCPRSNRHVGVGSPPLEAFYAMDVDVAFGTDSLASVPDLNMFAELAEAHRLAPRVPARRLLESATLQGARALGCARDFGSIEPGKRASLIAVRVPEGVRDVEEFLVSGVGPDAVTWVHDETRGRQLPSASR